MSKKRSLQWLRYSACAANDEFCFSHLCIWVTKILSFHLRSAAQNALHYSPQMTISMSFAMLCTPNVSSLACHIRSAANSTAQPPLRLQMRLVIWPQWPILRNLKSQPTSVLEKQLLVPLSRFLRAMETMRGVQSLVNGY